ncbi:DUF2306 domain-containing protein [Acidisoma silvae]|nr:DUF2306 domain-containing protein [Acidisoma silvae]
MRDTLSLASPIVLGHIAAAVLALLIGTLILLRRKGTLSHQAMGWVWVGLMTAVAVLAIPIRTYRGLPNIDGFTPIHLFVVLVLVTLPRGVWAIYHGNRLTHGKAMRGLFFGGLVLAGLFTLLPDRLLGHLLWHDVLHLM